MRLILDILCNIIPTNDYTNIYNKCKKLQLLYIFMVNLNRISFMKSFLIRIILVILFSLFLLVLMNAIFEPGEVFSDPVLDVMVICFFIIANEGIFLIDKFMDKKMPWLQNIKRRLWLQPLLSVLLLFLVSLSAFYITHDKIYLDKIRIIQFYVYTILGVVLILFINAAFISVSFFRIWQRSLIDNEKLKQDKLESDYKALQNQLNPHFLFNSLNVLISEIKFNQENAVLFTEKLSDIYRYILQSKNHNLVTILHELEHIKSFIFLYEVRLGSSFTFSVNLPDDVMVKKIPPISLQTLVENVFKHNIMTEKEPVDIVVEMSDNKDYIVIRNQLNEKKVHYSTFTGLENLRLRYSVFTDLPVVISKDKNEFRVELPLI